VRYCTDVSSKYVIEMFIDATKKADGAYILSAQGVADDVQMFIWKIIVKGVGYYRLYNQSDLHIMTSSMERQIYGRKICIASPLAT